jgi:hypothetical protein
MNDLAQAELIEKIYEARQSLNRQLSAAHCAGLRVTVDVREHLFLNKDDPQVQVETSVYKKIG